MLKIHVKMAANAQQKEGNFGVIVRMDMLGNNAAEKVNM